MKIIQLHCAGRPPLTVYNASRYFLRLRGLIGRTLEGVDGLLLTPCAQIHTFFMRFPIDAVYLDAAGKVLHIDRAVPPGRALGAVKGARRVLELPANEAAARRITPGEFWKCGKD